VGFIYCGGDCLFRSVSNPSYSVGDAPLFRSVSDPSYTVGVDHLFRSTRRGSGKNQGLFICRRVHPVNPHNMTSIAIRSATRSVASQSTPERQKTLPAGLGTRHPCRVTSGLPPAGLIPVNSVPAVGFKPRRWQEDRWASYTVVATVFSGRSLILHIPMGTLLFFGRSPILHIP